MRFDAQWIWGPGEPAPRNMLMQFRRSFSLDAVPGVLRLHISADSRYFLYLNGVRIGYGPPRNYHSHYEYDTYDVTQHLVPGTNVVAVGVSHWGEGTFLQMVGRGGLVLQLADGDTPVLRSDANWKARPSAAHRRDVPRIACQLPWEEQFDARLEDIGWTTAAFDDTGWEPAVEVGPVGVAPWGQLSPRTIPFLTDEPLAPVGAQTLGLVRRPEAVAAVHAGPYLAPGDLSANRPTVDALLATVLHVPLAGEVTLKRGSVYGGNPPRFLVDGAELILQREAVDYSASVHLDAGAHVVVLDWLGRTHDLDITITASGVPGLAFGSPLAGDGGMWAVATAPGAARESAMFAPDPGALLRSGGVWRPVAAIDTPDADVYMDVTASTMVDADDRPVRFPVHVAPVALGLARHYLLDFGREVIGWIELDLTAPAGTTVDVLGFEAMQEGRPCMTELMNNTLRYVCRDGRQSYVSTLRRGFRYLIIAVHGAPGEAVLHHVGVRLATYPWDIQGDFRCADPRLNQIWELCAYTLRMCSEDTFTDCPAYEQTLWTGDSGHSDILLHQTVHGDPRLPRRSLLLIADSLRRLPIAGSQVPGDWENDLIPNWSWLWAMGCELYYQLTGDEAFVDKVYPALAKQAAFIDGARNAAGIIELPDFWHFLDWTPIRAGRDDILAHESCLAVAALRATAALALVAGCVHDAERWTEVANQLTGALNREFWRADLQAYADRWKDGEAGDGISQPTNIAAMLAGVADAEQAAAIAPNLLVSPEGWIPSGTPWMHALGCLVLAERGQMAEVLGSIRNRWGDMLDKGATTAWESFSDQRPGGSWTRSWCHAWSALPGYLLPAFVLGVRPLEPGFLRTLIAPELGDLRWAAGRVPTPHGPIAVRVERTGSGQVVSVTLPAGVAADVRVIADVGPTPRVTGAVAEIARDGDQFVVSLPPGATATVTSAAIDRTW